MAANSSLPALVDAAVARALYDFGDMDLTALDNLLPGESTNIQKGEDTDAKTVVEKDDDMSNVEGEDGKKNEIEGGAGDQDEGVGVQEGGVGDQEGGEAENSDPRPPLPQEASGQGKSGGKNIEAMLKTYREENPESRPVPDGNTKSGHASKRKASKSDSVKLPVKRSVPGGMGLGRGALVDEEEERALKKKEELDEIAKRKKRTEDKKRTEETKRTKDSKRTKDNKRDEGRKRKETTHAKDVEERDDLDKLVDEATERAIKIAAKKCEEEERNFRKSQLKKSFSLGTKIILSDDEEEPARSKSAPLKQYYKEDPTTYVDITCKAVNRWNKARFLGFLGFNHKTGHDSYGETWDEHKSVTGKERFRGKVGPRVRTLGPRFPPVLNLTKCDKYYFLGWWFQKRFANPEEAERYVHNRQGIQMWEGGIVSYAVGSDRKEKTKAPAGTKGKTK